MEGDGDGAVLSSSATPIPTKSMVTSSSPSAPAGGCSETAKAEEGKRLKTDNDGASEDLLQKSDVQGHCDDHQASGRGSGMPLVRTYLQNDVILTNLFERCPPKLLAKFRLVSKQWWKLSLTSWRDTARLTLYDDWHGTRHHLTIGKYLEFMDSPRNPSRSSRRPMTHSRMVLPSWRQGLRQPAINEFWVRFGRDLTSLELIGCEFPTVGDLRGVLFRSCPNLERLCLRQYCGCPESARVKDFRELKYWEPTFGEQNNLRVLSIIMPEGHRNELLPIHWLELLSHFPSLTSLKVSVDLHWGGTGALNEELLTAIQLIRWRDPRKLRLRSLELEPPVSFSTERGPHPELAHLEVLQLPLQFLKIVVGPRPNDQLRGPLLEDLLRRHSSTLSRITVIREYKYREGMLGSDLISRSPSSFEFPCNVALAKLEELRIYMLSTSMLFLKNTPKLKMLEFGKGFSEHFGDEERRMFPEPDATSTLGGVKLLHLTEFWMPYRVTLEDITIFAGLMPNLSKLAMSLDDTLFSTVCSSWGNLKEVDVFGKDLTDKGVTGLDDKGNKIAPANVTNLQGLESFRFSSRHLTDRSVWSGFLKLPSLKLLDCGGGILLGTAARNFLQRKKIDIRGEDYAYDEFVDEDDRDF